MKRIGWRLRRKYGLLAKAAAKNTKPRKPRPERDKRRDDER